MTNEEPLTHIKSTDYCFVDWSTALTEVVGEKPVGTLEAASDQTRQMA